MPPAPLLSGEHRPEIFARARPTPSHAGVSSSDTPTAGPGMRFPLHLRGVLAGAACTALVLAGCGGDGGPIEPDPPPLGLQRVSGNGQVAGTGGQLAAPLVVRVRRGGEASVSGEEVSWEVTAGEGAELVETETESGADGTASTGLVLGAAPGGYRVAASLEDGTSVEFSATAEERVFGSLAVLSGDDQSGQVTEELPDSLVVRTLDQFEDPIGQVTVSFGIFRGLSGAPSVEPATAVSDSSGRAATSLVLGSKNGTYGVRAVAGTDTAKFTASASGGTEFLLSLEDVSPAPLQAGGQATLVGAGFAADPADNEVRVDGREAEVLSATDTELTITVPTYEDLCLPRREVAVEVVVDPDVSQPVARELVPDVPEVDLSAGQDTLVVGPDVGCVLLPASAAGGAEYEVMTTPLPDAAGTSVMRLFVNGAAPPSASGETALSQAVRSRVVEPIRPAGGEPADWRHEQYEWDRRLRERERAWLPEIRSRAARAPSMSRTVGSLSPTTAAVGDTATFGVSCTSQPDVFAEVRAAGEAAVVYEDTVMRSRGTGFTDAQYDSIASRFDTFSFPVDTLYFGAPRDIDGNGSVVMLFTPAVNRLVNDYTGGFIAGFFCGRDLLPDEGNDAEMFYLVSPDSAGTFTPTSGDALPKDFIRSIIDGTVIHEFQHLINAQIGGGSAPDGVSPGGAQTPWLNEGLSHLAEEVGGHAITGNQPGSELSAAQLRADPEALRQFYLANFTNLEEYLKEPHAVEGLVSPSTGFDTRGAAWSFVRYLLDRTMDPASEHELTRALVGSTVTDDRGAIEDALATAAGSDVGFERVAADWNAAFSVEDRADLGGTPRAGLQLTSYQLRDVYGDEAFGAGGVYPLQPTQVSLHESTSVAADLFTGSARHVRLVSTSASSGTGVRLAAEDGEELDPAMTAPHLIIIRTR